jgi:chitin disaccharide deacetylase
LHKSETNQLLGYPDETRLLILNADDLGMYPAINEAISHAIREGIATSTTLMVPCPGAAQAIAMLQADSEIPFGVHLTVVRDFDAYRWGPVAPREDVPSLLDDEGDFYHNNRSSEVLARAKLDHVEIEFRAQIEAVLAAGLSPIHLDWHCLYNGGRADIFDLTMALGQEYGLAVRVSGQPFAGLARSQGMPTVDHDVVDSYRIPTADKPARYHQMLRALPPGLSEWAIHPSTGDAASQEIDREPEGWRVRRADFEFLMSPAARQIIEKEGIILLSYRPIQALWQAALARGGA